jgi:hypothetical protein
MYECSEPERSDDCMFGSKPFIQIPLRLIISGEVKHHYTNGSSKQTRDDSVVDLSCDLQSRAVHTVMNGGHDSNTVLVTCVSYTLVLGCCLYMAEMYRVTKLHIIDVISRDSLLI